MDDSILKVGDIVCLIYQGDIIEIEIIEDGKEFCYAQTTLNFILDELLNLSDASGEWKVAKSDVGKFVFYNREDAEKALLKE